MVGFKNLGHKQLTRQQKGGITRAHLNIMNGAHDGDFDVLKKQHKGNKAAQEHIKHLNKLAEENYDRHG